MRIAIEHAGAERGLLILPRRRPAMDRGGSDHRPQNGCGQPPTCARDRLGTSADRCCTYVIRTRESVILDDAARARARSRRTNISLRKRARSVLCLPLIKQAKLIGVLYLENNVAASVFTPARIAVLELLASQAAISLENARLYGELTVSEERWRKLVRKRPRRRQLGWLAPTLCRGEPGLSENDRLLGGRTPWPYACRHNP